MKKFKWLLSHSWSCEIVSPSIVIHPPHGNPAHWAIAAMTLDSHLTSPCSMWFIWVCWLNRGFFFSPFALSLFALLLLSQLFKNYFLLGLSLSLLCFCLCWCFLKNVRQIFGGPITVSHVGVRSLKVVCVVRRQQSHSRCPGGRPKHYTRERVCVWGGGTSKFLMWCDRPSHWTLLKGVNLPFGDA